MCDDAPVTGIRRHDPQQPHTGRQSGWLRGTLTSRLVPIGLNPKPAPSTHAQGALSLSVFHSFVLPHQQTGHETMYMEERHDQQGAVGGRKLVGLRWVGSRQELA